MEDAPLPIIKTPNEEIKESFEIEQQEKIYKLNIKIINQEIILNILDEKDFMKEYEFKSTFDELKDMHKIFLTFSSSQEFMNFFKATIENKKVLVKKNKENQMTIEFIIEYIFKQNIIKFDLNQKKINFELIAQDLYQKFVNINEICKNLEFNYKQIIEENNKIKEDIKSIKEDYKILKQENQKLNDEKCKLEEKIKIIENENKNLINRVNIFEIGNNALSKDLKYLNKNNISNSINSTIIENDELEMIYSEIKEKMNKEIIDIKKIYQATKDGGDYATFHKLCDGISNTLVLYKSVGDRRFGGFASQCWKTGKGVIPDKNCFLFSLDKKKIFNLRDNPFEIVINSKDGPSFSKNGKYIIEIYGNALKDKKLKTYEKKFKDIFGEDRNALSEDGEYKGVYAKEYEVFQIIFD